MKEKNVELQDLRKKLEDANVIIREKDQQLEDQYFVRIFYKNDSAREPYELFPPGCEEPCRLKTFIRVANERIPHDWEAQCQVVRKKREDALNSIAVVLITAGTVFFVVVFSGVLTMKLCKRSKLQKTMSP